MKKQLLIIAGPTASGKSPLAMDLACDFQGCLINGDSIQIYGDIPLLSAAPSEDDKRKVPHKLYGVLKASEDCSVADWLALACREVRECHREGLLPIVAGGTGLYLHALLKGLSPFPEIDPALKKQASEDLETSGYQEIYRLLITQDPRLREKIKPTDRQRICRAWEILKATGASILSLVETAPPEDPLPDVEKIVILILPPKDLLLSKAEQRLKKMFREGAVEEVRNLLTKEIHPRSTLLKAVGVPEVSAYVRGDISLEEAFEDARKATNRYIKRQLTWFRTQLKAHITLEKLYEQSSFAELKIMLKQQHLLEE